MLFIINLVVLIAYAVRFSYTNLHFISHKINSFSLMYLTFDV